MTYNDVVHSSYGPSRPSYDGEDDREDDVDFVSMPAMGCAVVMDPGRREMQVRRRLSEHIESYISACSSASGTVPESSRYLRVLSECAPLREVHVGQSSYSSGILPSYASAFAFDYRAAGSWTPSVQVLSQAASLEFGVPTEQVLAVLSNSYILAPRGIAFINVVPYERCDAQLHVKLESRASELMTNLAVASAIMGSRKLTFVEYGDEAKAAGDAFWASVKSSGLPISRVAVRNPVWVSRNFPGNPSLQGPLPSDEAMLLYSRYSRRYANAPAFGHRLQHWMTYTRSQLSHVRPRVTMKLISSLIRSESIEQIAASFAKLVEDMSTRKSRDDEDGPESYVSQVLRQISEDSRRQVTTASEALDLAKSAVSKAKKGDRESLEAMVPVLRACVDAQVVAAGFFSSLPSTLSSEVSALSLGVNSLPPVVRAYSSGTEPTQASSHAMRLPETSMTPPRPRLNLTKVSSKDTTVAQPKPKGLQRTAYGMEPEGRGETKGPSSDEGSATHAREIGRGDAGVRRPAKSPANDEKSAIVVSATTEGSVGLQDPFSDYAQSPSTYGSYSSDAYPLGPDHSDGASLDDSPFDHEDYAIEEGLDYPSVFSVPKGTASVTDAANRVLARAGGSKPAGSVAPHPDSSRARDNNVTPRGGTTTPSSPRGNHGEETRQAVGGTQDPASADRPRAAKRDGKATTPMRALTLGSPAKSGKPKGLLKITKKK